MDNMYATICNCFYFVISRVYKRMVKVIPLQKNKLRSIQKTTTKNNHDGKKILELERR